MYVNVLRGSKLESKLREKPRGSGRSVESIMLQMKRCSSLGDLDLSSGYKGRNVRESYVMAIYKGWGSNLFAVKKFMSQLAFAIQVEDSNDSNYPVSTKVCGCLYYLIGYCWKNACNQLFVLMKG